MNKTKNTFYTHLTNTDLVVLWGKSTKREPVKKESQKKEYIPSNNTWKIIK